MSSSLNPGHRQGRAVVNALHQNHQIQAVYKAFGNAKGDLVQDHKFYNKGLDEHAERAASEAAKGNWPEARNASNDLTNSCIT